MSARKWSLEDLVEFEARLRDSGGSGVSERRRYQDAVAKVKRWPRGEAARRRLGLRLWLKAAGDEEEIGLRVGGALRIAGLVLGTIACLAGIGVMRGLLTDVMVRSYNVWLFLAATLGVQWLVLLLGIGGYVFVRRQSGAISLFEQLGSWLVRRIAGGFDKSLVRRLLEGGAGYRSAFSWRLARLVQGVAVMFNVGLLLGFYGCLAFLNVRFYWESTFEGIDWGLLDFMRGMATPWSWSGWAMPPGPGEVAYSVIENPELQNQIFYEQEGVQKIWLFLMASLLVYGLLPRALLWLWCLRKERRALAAMEFQAPRHRELWRRLTRVERSLVSTGPGDSVVLLDVGGSGVKTKDVREFLLRELRVNPVAKYAAGVLDGAREDEALEAIEKAELGVVLLVEGWSLSPKQMRVLHRRIREVGGEDLSVYYLVIGELRRGRPSAPGPDDWLQWKDFVDSLQDPAGEVVAYAEPAALKEEA